MTHEDLRARTTQIELTNLGYKSGVRRCSSYCQTWFSEQKPVCDRNSVSWLVWFLHVKVSLSSLCNKQQQTHQIFARLLVLSTAPPSCSFTLETDLSASISRHWHEKPSSDSKYTMTSKVIRHVLRWHFRSIQFGVEHWTHADVSQSHR